MRCSNTAKNVIYILLAGAPSQIDTFDLRVGPWTPQDFRPTSINGIDFPEGLLPNIASQLSRMAIVRSCYSNGTGALAASNMEPDGAKSGERNREDRAEHRIDRRFGIRAETNRGQKLPGFVALNSTGGLSGKAICPAAFHRLMSWLPTTVSPIS